MKRKPKNPFRAKQAKEGNTNTTERDANGIPEDTPGTDLDDTVATDSSATETPSEPRNDSATYDALNERYLRLLAEYDNFRKRSAKEREQLYHNATEDLIKEILPIFDNLDRATELRNTDTSLDEYVEGIALIEEQLRNVLSHAGLVAIEVVGQPFDPHFHDAVMQIETDEFESGIVAQEVQKGYTLGKQVIRHSKVIVSK